MATTKSANLEKLQEEVLNSLVSLINSIGGECDVDTLHRDYKDLVGSPVPVRQFSHATLASLLMAHTKLFACTNKGGQLFVKAKDNKNSSHIAKLAREQKTATRKIKGRPKPARRPDKLSWMPDYNGRQMNYGGGIHMNWREPFRPFQPMNNAFGSRPRNPNMNVYMPPSTRSSWKPLPNRSQAPPRRPENMGNISKNQSVNKSKVPLLSKPKSPPPAKSKTPPLVKPKSPPPNTSKLSQPVVKSKPTVNLRSPLLPTPLIPKVNPVAHIPKVNPVAHIPKDNPVALIPKVNPSALYYNDGNFSFPRAIRDNQEKQYAPYFEVPPRFKKTETTGKNVIKTQKEMLEEEVKRRGIKEDLVFRSIAFGKKGHHWICTVDINGTKLSSYPEEYAQAQEAEEEVARKALKLLKEQDEARYPVTGDLETSIERVEKILKHEPGDVWFDTIQDWYRAKFNESLQSNWAQEVQKYNEANNKKFGVIVDKRVNDRWTVTLKQQETSALEKYLAPQSEDSQVNASALYESFTKQYVNAQEETFQQHVDPTVNRLQDFYLQDNNLNVDSSTLVNTKVSGLNGGEAEKLYEIGGLPKLPNLEMPMSTTWDIYVTLIGDVSSISFRLIGEGYSEAFDDMVTEMELYYMEDKNMSPVKEPKIGYIYAASYDDSWCRVKVLERLGNEVRVKFIDHGDIEDLPLSQLHNLHEKFMELAAQCVSCSLAGLEFCGRDQSALALLQNMALGYTLVAHVVSRGDNIPSLILYNTSTDEDVNINEKVSEQMVLNFVEPTLPQIGGVTEVYLMNITSSGDIYVQIETETYKVLQNLLEMARSRIEEMLGEDVKIDLTRLYLARFSEDGEWYRAVPRANVDPNGKVLMWFVDFGNNDQVPTASIRPLEEKGKLNKIPHQALLCRLHNVPSSDGLQWTVRACQRLIDLVPDNAPLLLRVHSSGINGGPPTVELFKRLQHNNELVSINATLSMDESLFSPVGDSNNNSLTKEVILSPTRTRNRCGSSNSITSGSSGLNSGPSSMNSQHELTSRASSPLEMSKRFQQPGSLSPMNLPAVGEYFDVYITYAASPSNFAVQPWKMTTKLTSLMEDMQKYYSQEANLKTESDMRVGGYYAVKHSDGTWYRAYLTMANEAIITGRFVDFGDCFAVMQDCVQPLHSVFHSLPCQAIKAKLAGVVATNMDWRPEDSYRFKELVEYRELVSIITNIEQDRETSEYILSLRLVDTSDLQLDIFIDDILVDEERAIKVKE